MQVLFFLWKQVIHLILNGEIHFFIYVIAALIKRLIQFEVFLIATFFFLIESVNSAIVLLSQITIKIVFNCVLKFVKVNLIGFLNVNFLKLKR